MERVVKGIYTPEFRMEAVKSAEADVVIPHSATPRQRNSWETWISSQISSSRRHNTDGLEDLKTEGSSGIAKEISMGKVNPALRALNKRNKEFWDKRNTVQDKLLTDPKTAEFIIDGLHAEQMKDAYLREVNAYTRSTEVKLQRIHDSAQHRMDQKDKRAFIAWIEANNIIVQRISDLWDIKNFTWGGYAKNTLKKWYKESKPRAKLIPGRPRK